MNLVEILLNNQKEFANIFPFDLHKIELFTFDFSVNNHEMQELNFNDPEALNNYVKNKLKDNNIKVGIGGYSENRLVYKRSAHFGTGENSRSIHLGVDIWCDVNTPIFAFADSIVHSFQINDNFGDYGPTIILEHSIDGITFYSLYGHLAKTSLDNLQEGKKIAKGEKFAEVGNSTENGNWPPHLHLQIIKDMLGYKGDFYGVCSPSETGKFLELCPNPKLILNYG